VVHGLVAFWRLLSRRVLAGAVIVIIAALLAQAFATLRPLSAVLGSADNVFYDAYYRLRPGGDQRDGPVVIVDVDDNSLAQVDRDTKFGWPWPRSFWGFVAQYLGRCGARAVVFDLTFEQTSVYQHSDGDDDTFAALVQDAHVPVVFGSAAGADGAWAPMAPPVQNPRRGAVNVLGDAMVRTYPPTVNGLPSLALAAIEAAGMPPRLPTDRPFQLHYYGPHQLRSGAHTFRYLPAAVMLKAALPAGATAQPSTSIAGFDPKCLAGKIVLIGAITAGAYDLKSSPLSALYPGVEVHATAIDNLLAGQVVQSVSPLWRAAMPWLAAAVVVAGVLTPRRAWLKMLAPLAVAAAICLAGAILFRQPAIRWLPPAAPLLATALASLGAFGWTYLLEDRQRRFMLAALSKVVSPAVAQQLARDPQRLSLGTVRTNITLLFTDLANFTSMSETMDVQQLSALLNLYLAEMSDQILNHQGTLDKYIGDSIMSFWNAPLPQADHAVLACRAALAIVQREQQLRTQHPDTPAAQLWTRIGINTTDAAVGFVGSSHLFNYTALGNGVNLASRLEGANKLYGSRILLSQSTAELVRNQFLLRKLDVLRVKGKRQPMAVYELLADLSVDDHDNRCQHLRGLAGLYEGAFAHYQNRRFDLAERDLEKALAQFGDDPASYALLSRIRQLHGQAIDPNWDGVFEALHK
jgi:adenylate cyclase